MIIGIIGAMHEEIEGLKELLLVEKTEEIAGFKYYIGRLNGKNIVLVESGIGKVNASVCTTILIDKFKVNKIIFTGVAGAVNEDLSIGDIVVGESLIEHDFDCTAFGLEPGTIPRMDTSCFLGEPELVNLGVKSVEKILGKSRVKKGTIVSGDQFIASKEKIKWLERTFNAQCTEMEGAAVAHVAHLFGVPFVILRALSDKADGSAHMDFKEFVKMAAVNSKKVVLEMLKNL